MTVLARAFAPAHVTGVFRPSATGPDPRGAGSIGAGLVFDVGATATVRFTRGARHLTEVRGPSGEALPITEDAVRRVRKGVGGRVTVEVEWGLPVGQGFGMSAAGTLAASLATAKVLGEPVSLAVEAAHLAELSGRGGLGGVAAILGGGVELRRVAGIPPLGRVRHLRWDGPAVLLVGTGPPIPSPSILGSAQWIRRIEIASRGLDDLLAHPTPEGFLRLSERFTDRMGLGAVGVHRLIRELRALGAHAAQAMFGNAIFVVPPTRAIRAAVIARLVAGGRPAVEVRVGRRGARTLPEGAAASRRPPQRL